MKEIFPRTNAADQSNLHQQFESLNKNSAIYRLLPIVSILALIFLPIFGYEISPVIGITIIFLPIAVTFLTSQARLEKKIDLLFHLNSENQGTNRIKINDISETQ